MPTFELKRSVTLCLLVTIISMVAIVRTDSTDEDSGEQSHFQYSSNKRIPGELRPPIHRNRIIRVSRGPTIPSSSEEFHTSHQQSIKSPPYQLRFHRPGSGRLSQLHGYSILTGRTPNSNGLNILNIPGIGRSSHGEGQGQSSQTSNQQILQSMNELFPLEDQFEANSEDEEPTFTPYISARALSNMEKFFHHLRENINAVQQEGQDYEPNSGLLASQLEFSGGDENGNLNSNNSPSDWDSSESELDEGAGGNSNPSQNSGQARESVLGVRWKPPASASGIMHGQGNNNPMFGNNPSSRLNTRNYRYVPSVTSSPIISTIQDPDFKRANNFNPSWMWTNLGLGKK